MGWIFSFGISGQKPPKDAIERLDFLDLSTLRGWISWKVLRARIFLGSHFLNLCCLFAADSN